ncbi:uncharacterized protein N7515_008371 [Penicillium bovifimosum]|uniref:Phosphatidylglycerol lysyltransferase C-terminal domain-containing protein n=1 Tax=Penicillium bovifimosum TaxID=126998 RepID=A0A9W9GMX1_9EURO|nr:uncharacterized protein N7515_008371 [Penicillium bovifimosum]KAJ5124546.1 hypothetical protein N7515_008371 [Penicillium bovifimosum]
MQSIPPITVTVGDSNQTIIVTPSTPEKRMRRARKGNHLAVSESKTKSLLSNEIGDALMNQLYAAPKRDDHDDPLNTSCVSLLDHLQKNIAATSVTSCASSASYSTRTAAESASTPGTSVGIGEALDGTHTQVPIDIDFSHTNTECYRTKATKKYGGDKAIVFSLDDFKTMTAIEQLAAQHGRVAHMGILDHSYRFFVNKSRTGALSFKVQNGVAVVGGDPLCSPDAIAELLSEFAAYRRRHRWSIAFMGASRSFLRDYAHPNGWTTIRFATERVLNPQTNDILLERNGKRITTQNRQLLNPRKGGITLGVYAPVVHGTDPQLQSELIAIYDAWRAERNCSTSPQAFITVYDPFALPALMTFIYTRGADGMINGFAALRHLGSGGYHVDPCIAAPGSPKGISDLLLVAAMALLYRAGVSYLGFGFEPLNALVREDVSGMPAPLGRFTCNLYGRAFHRLPIGGKKAYHDKFRPDSAQDSALYLVFPPGIPSPRHLLAMTHMANISWRKIFWADVRGWALTRRSKAAAKGIESLDEKKGAKRCDPIEQTPKTETLDKSPPPAP